MPSAFEGFWVSMASPFYAFGVYKFEWLKPFLCFCGFAVSVPLAFEGF